LALAPESDQAFHLEDDSVAERLQRLFVEAAALVEIRHVESDVIDHFLSSRLEAVAA
jgi:hypothetical protein